MTHDEPGEETSEHETVHAEDPTAVLALNHPLRDRNNLLPLLRSIRVPVREPVLPSHIVRQSVRMTERRRVSSVAMDVRRDVGG